MKKKIVIKENKTIEQAKCERYFQNVYIKQPLSSSLNITIHLCFLHTRRNDFMWQEKIKILS